MILFINVFLEHNAQNLLISPYGMQYDRGNFPLYSKGEIFLYTLESYKTINWSQIIIYCEVNEDFPDKDNYYSKINKIFPEAKVYTTRNAYQHQWQKALDELGEEDELIWYAGNHDHPYIAPNHEQLNAIVDILNSSDSFYKGALYSHHPDICARIMTEPEFGWQYESKLVSSYTYQRTEGIMIINKNLFRSWWFDYDYGDTFIPRSDWTNGVRCQTPEAKIYLPVRELCRHFDGHNFGGYAYEIRDIPPLDIPPGFWQGDIKIDYLTDQRIEGNVWINPQKNYFVIDESGADYKFLLKDIPLFWEDRISVINQGADENKLFLKARNIAIHNAANSRIYMNNMMVRKGVTWAEMREKRTRLPLYYLKDLLS